MTSLDADRWLDSPLRLVLVAELLNRRAIPLREAVILSGRHEQDVVACLEPLVAAGVLARHDLGFGVSASARADLVSALRAGVATRRERLDRERFVRSRVLGSLIGVDPKMQLVFEAIRQVCRLDVPVLITGETGSGKELVARAIHELGSRRGGVFEAVNCGALPSALFESQVFGHVRGAFTGATQDHVGIFERCDGGTAFLDEIGELEIGSQVKLLRVLQDRTFQRLGDTATRRSSFRLIAATHRDLPSMIARGAFREDLYYRCNVFSIRVPSLRERPEDLPYIVDGLLEASRERFGLSHASTLTPAAMSVLRGYRWPGNVRELENVLIRAAIASEGRPIGPADLTLGGDATHVENVTVRGDTSKTLAEVERDHIVALLDATQWNVRVAAQRLGIARASLYRKLSEHGLVRPTRSRS